MNKSFTITEVTVALEKICLGLEAKKDLFLELDAATGDGDLGVTVDKAFKAVRAGLGAENEDVGQLLINAGKNISISAPSTMGALLGFAFMNAGKAVHGKKEVNLKDLLDMVWASEKAISEKGKAQPGDKTMLDALIPARQALFTAVENNQSEEAALKEAKNAANAGAEKTKEMVAKVGRARWQGERTIGNLDPGAVVVSCFFEELYKAACE